MWVLRNSLPHHPKQNRKGEQGGVCLLSQHWGDTDLGSLWVQVQHGLQAASRTGKPGLHRETLSKTKCKEANTQSPTRPTGHRATCDQFLWRRPRTTTVCTACLEKGTLRMSENDAQTVQCHISNFWKSSSGAGVLSEQLRECTVLPEDLSSISSHPPWVAHNPL